MEDLGTNPFRWPSPSLPSISEEERLLGMRTTIFPCNRKSNYSNYVSPQYETVLSPQSKILPLIVKAQGKAAAGSHECLRTNYFLSFVNSLFAMHKPNTYYMTVPILQESRSRIHTHSTQWDSCWKLLVAVQIQGTKFIPATNPEALSSSPQSLWFQQ